jgi:glycosyltransferase involved in cell wall biosynthesis
MHNLKAYNRMYRILYTIPNFITAGSGRAMLNIIQRLDRKRFEPTIAVLKPGGKLYDEIQNLGITLFCAPFTVHPIPYTTLLSRSYDASKAFPHHRFDLWHSFHYSDDYTEPIIAHFAGVKKWIFTKNNMGWGSRAWYGRSVLANALPCQNKDMLKIFYSAQWYSYKARLIAPGVDISAFHPQIEPSLGLRSKLGIDKNAIIITCVAELVQVKGHPTLIDAMAGIPNAHLWLAGRFSDDDYTQQLYKQVQDLGIADRIHFLGGVQNVPALLAETDIFVLPTINRGEGCAIALLEAMACAKACVATDVPGSRDVISHGQNGFLADAESPERLRLFLEILIGDIDLRFRFGSAARQHILQNYTIEREVAKYEALYLELLS